MAKYAEIAASISEKIAAQLEAGASAADFRLPWNAMHGLPRNAASGRAYRGMNIFILFDEPWWASFKQWKELGRQVRKGEKARGIGFFAPLERGGEPVLDDKGRQVWTQRAYSVFSFAQTDPIEGAEKIWEPPAQPAGAAKIEEAEAIVKALRPNIAFGFSKAAYARLVDQIIMPAPEAFESTEGYYATLFHELGHWTGAESRLGREKGAEFGDDAYAFEELIAELTAAICCASLGIDQEPRIDHAQYIASWIRQLRADSSAFPRAAAAAQKAASWILEGGQQKKEAAA